MGLGYKKQIDISVGSSLEATDKDNVVSYDMISVFNFLLLCVAF